MLNSIFLLSVAPARQIGYKLWNPETGTAPDMYLLDGDSESAVASWQATFASTSDRTLVVGSKNLDLGVASASRPLGLKVVGAMDRLAIALNNVALASQERDPAAGHDVSAPRAGSTLPTSAPESMPKQEQTLARVTSGMTAQQPALSASMNASMSALSPMSPAASTLSSAANTMASAANTLSTAANTMSAASQTLSSKPAMTASTAAATNANAMPVTMTAAAPAATVLPSMTLQPNVTLQPNAPLFDKSLNEKPVPEKTVDKILSEKHPAEKPIEKTQPSPIAGLQSSGVTPLSPSALSAAVAPSTSATSRVNLRVVATPPLAASLPGAAPTAKAADAPLHPPPTVTVNLSPPAMPATPPPAPVGHGAHMARHEEHNFRVLAVDDSPLMRTFLQNKLAPYGIQPEFAASGEEALFKISKQHYDLIFLDVMLPGMDGYDVCKMIKKNKDNALMKVVMLTSKDKTFDKIRGTMAGCDGYLTKPVDELKLRAIIERHSVAQK